MIGRDHQQGALVQAGLLQTRDDSTHDVIDVPDLQQVALLVLRDLPIVAPANPTHRRRQRRQRRIALPARQEHPGLVGQQNVKKIQRGLLIGRADPVNEGLGESPPVVLETLLHVPLPRTR